MRLLVEGFAAVLGPRARRFERALADPARAQARLLARIAQNLARTEYGASLAVHGAEDFHRRVPIVDYEDLAPWISRQMHERAPILTPDRVRCFEKTSGSTGPAKYIPYTRALLGSFTSAFMVWAHDLLVQGPRFSTGRLYFSISPSFGVRQSTTSGAAVGLEDDRDYLAGWLRPMLSPFFVATSALAKETDADRFQLRLAARLLSEPRLEVISIWNPSFLTVIFDRLQRDLDRVLEEPELAISAARRAQVREAVPARAWTQVWPELKLVSCWASAHAAPLSRRLASELPGVMVQGKGILATEAPITVPRVGLAGGAPMIDEVYLELEPAGGGAPVPIDRAELDAEYQLIVSQLGGLCRYRLGDRVRVVGRAGATPALELIGRGPAVCDLVGEKLHEAFVAGAIEALPLEDAGIRALIPVRAPLDHYVLLLDRSPRATPLEGVAAALEELLQRAHHYRHARRLGQLQAAQVRVREDAADLLARYHSRRGMKLGDIKPSSLLTVPADATLTGELG